MFIQNSTRRFQVSNLGRRFLGQAPPPVNRLLDLRTDFIMSRYDILSGASGWQVHSEGLNQGDIPESVRKTLAEVMANPTPEELRDLALINSFFGTDYWGNMAAVCEFLQNPRAFIQPRVSGGASMPAGGWGQWTPPIVKEWRTSSSLVTPFAVQMDLSSPFFCALSPDVPDVASSSAVSWGYVFPAFGGAPSYFGINFTEYWGDIRYAVNNAITFMKVMETYPFPSPISVRPQVWYNHSRAGIQDLIRQPVYLPPDLIRFWVTMNVAYNYTVVSEEVLRQMENKARRQKRMDLIEKVAMTATLAIITVGIASAIAPLIPAGAAISSTQVASSITGGLNQIVSIEEKKRAAESMEKVAKQFEQDDPAWAKEVDDAAHFLDHDAAEQEKYAGLTPEEQEAIDQAAKEPLPTPATAGYQYDAPLPGPSLLPVVGGLAAVGLVAWAIFS